jgi:hypothetical protein
MIYLETMLIGMILLASSHSRIIKRTVIGKEIERKRSRPNLRQMMHHCSFKDRHRTATSIKNAGLRD